jgi:hypothetical protein
MGKFVGAERAQVAHIGGNEYALSRAIDWQTDSGAVLTVPMGFVSDLGSIPWPVRWLFKPGDEAARRAYLLHDYILTLMKRGLCSSQYAASQFYEAMKADGVPLWSRRLQYHGVSLGIAGDEW